MSIWSKVLIALILVATLPFFYFSLRLLKTNQAWRSEVNKWEQDLGRQVDGPPDLATLTEEVRVANVKLHDIVVDRGRVWTSVNPERAFNSNTGKGNVVIEAPVPHRMTAKMVVFAFDPTGYLGEFQVTEAGEKSVTLEPNMRMSDRQLKRVSTSPGNWTLYEVMPIDRHDIFTGLDQEALGKLLPAERVKDYVRDNQPAEANDPPSRVIDGKFERQLTDYGMLFHEMDRQISTAADLKAAAQKDAASLDTAVADAKQQVAFHTKEIADLKKELATSRNERDMMTAQCKALRAEIAQTRVDMKKEFQKNRALAQRWNDLQTHLAELHETSAVATP
ncbi:MAG TPA: hypothetical protein VHD36_22175 [Pirellulales bacterium]|nr:hypothetical protein [Pirellulales bacterium]